jgi:hypothetical protein
MLEQYTQRNRDGYTIVLRQEVFATTSGALQLPTRLGAFGRRWHIFGMMENSSDKAVRSRHDERWEECEMMFGRSVCRSGANLA